MVKRNQEPVIKMHQQNWSILLVEDDEVDQKYMRRLFASSFPEMSLFITSSLHGARELLAMRDFDCVLMDLGLPDGQGLSLLDILGPIPMIVLTGHDDEKFAMETIRLGVQGYLVKGQYSASHLLRMIFSAIERARLQKDREVLTAELYRTIKELGESNRRLEQQAMLDSLTGLHNRRALDQRTQDLIREGQRGRKFSLVALDIDHFKKINDTHGHQQGDALLKQFGGWLQRQSREVDFVARYGGEEFVLLLVDTTLQEATAVAERLCTLLSEENLLYSITASFGVSTYHEQWSTLETLLRAADNALYQAKSKGRNCVVTATVPDTNSGSHQEM